MRNDSKHKAGRAGSLTGMILAFGFLAGCSQTGSDATMSLQPNTAASASTFAMSGPVASDTSEAATEVAAASLPTETTVFPTAAPAYAASDMPASGERLQQVAALDSDQMTGPASPTTDYSQILRRRADAVAFSSRDHECLARAMYFESNRSSREGMVAVGSVVMNRVRSGDWGDTVCEVVGAPNQFAPGVLTRSMDSSGAPLAAEAARAVLKGERDARIYDTVMHFHTAGHRFSYDNMHYVAVAGGNSFYEKRRRMRGRENRPQSAIMAMTSAPARAAEAIAKPVRKVLKTPVEMAKRLAHVNDGPADAAPTPPAAVPIPVAAPASEPDSTRFGSADDFGGGKSGRVIRRLTQD